MLLPAPFSPKQRVHLAGPHVEVDAVVGDHPGEPLGDAAHLEQRQCVARRKGGVPRSGRLDRHWPFVTTILPLTILAMTFFAVSWILVGVFEALLNWIFSPPFFSEIRYETPPSFPSWTRVMILLRTGIQSYIWVATTVSGASDACVHCVPNHLSLFSRAR